MGTATPAVILLSGGLDSTVLLYHLLAEGAEVRALSVDYGQRHRRELEAAHAIACRAGVAHRVAEMHTGLQHVRQIEGVRAYGKQTGADVDLWIVSAGYGLIPGERPVAPYEPTF